MVYFNRASNLIIGFFGSLGRPNKVNNSEEKDSKTGYKEVKNEVQRRIRELVRGHVPFREVQNSREITQSDRLGFGFREVQLGKYKVVSLVISSTEIPSSSPISKVKVYPPLFSSGCSSTKVTFQYATLNLVSSLAANKANS
ncbi:hypothetical protein WICPIJ_007402 [Wickerhamomyces pijperi]|uniref:Uncharacterized protein n=1 Tax=Wickerhamomyces pijperi TaxID=599730 RepID=A0A9P8PZV0_WICPI|nr:hypothetical protein WICPIJ_007402 [Wickerhamomyces pijperi]